jgi:hypothetical protein
MLLVEYENQILANNVRVTDNQILIRNELQIFVNHVRGLKNLRSLYIQMLLNDQN